MAKKEIKRGEKREGIFAFLKKLQKKPETKKEEVDEHVKVMAEVQDDLRDLINWIQVRNKEEIEGGTKEIEDDAAAELIARIRAIAMKLGVGAL